MSQPKAYSYLRFSTPEQSRGDSSRRQIDAAEAYALRHGLELDASLRFEDRGVSGFTGANVRQGALGQFLRAVDDGLVEPGSFLLVENLDRMSRASPWDAMPIFQQIINAGVTIVTLQDDRVWSRAEMQDNPFRIFESLMVMIRANEESATKSRRLGQAWKEKRRKAEEASVPMTAVAPAWLELDRSRGSYRVLEGRAEIVRRIFTMTLDGIGQHQIADTFNREGVPTFGRATFWHRSYVKKILENPAVIGTFTPHLLDRSGTAKRRIPQAPIHGYFPAVVQEGVFQDVQAQRLGGQHLARQGGKHPIASIFAGLAECPLCGGTMTRVWKGSKGGKARLVCARAKTGAGCEYHGVHVEQAERALVENASWLEAHAPGGDDDVDAEVEHHRTSLEVLNGHIGNLLEAISGGAVGPAINARLADLETAKEDLQRRLFDLQAQQSAETGRLVERRISDLHDALALRPFEEWQPEDRRLVNACMRQVLKSVVVDYRTGFLELQWKHGGTSSVLFGFPRN